MIKINRRLIYNFRISIYIYITYMYPHFYLFLYLYLVDILHNYPPPSMLIEK